MEGANWVFTPGFQQHLFLNLKLIGGLRAASEGNGSYTLNRRIQGQKFMLKCDKNQLNKQTKEQYDL